MPEDLDSVAVVGGVVEELVRIRSVAEAVNGKNTLVGGFKNSLN